MQINWAKVLFSAALSVAATLALSAGTGGGDPAKRPRDTVTKIVAQVQRADYEGDRAALRRLYDELEPFAADKELGAKVQYWRGFALWRRALNGFNESADRSELEQDLTLAVSEFEKALARDPGFVDAKVAAASCLHNLSFLYFTGKDAVRARELMEKSLPLLEEAEAAEPENPRLLWVLGAYQWYNPPERGGGQAIAIETYQKGWKAARRQKSVRKDVLTPSWGEPELLMNLGFAYLHRAQPDLAAAEQYAQQALVLVPYWHYVRDILLPDIRKARGQQRESGPRSDAGPIAGRTALEPCRLSGLEEELRCGRLQVLENPGAPTGRTISLRIVVMPALGSLPAPDPLVVLMGGPGSAAASFAFPAARLFGRIRQKRDIVLVDRRGTGDSNPLNCTLPGSEDDPRDLLEMFPLESLRKCHTGLEQRADLRYYTSQYAMDDLEAVRAALGYDTLNLFGSSYGTWEAQIYQQRYPHRVRTMVLQGVVSQNYQVTRHYAQSSQRALDKLFASCDADADCRRNFPKLRDEFAAVMENLQSAPVHAEVRPPVLPKTASVELTRGNVAESLRFMLYVPPLAVQIPALIHQAHHGDFGALAGVSITVRRALGGGVSMGLYLSVTCPQDLALLDIRKAAREAQGTFLGESRLQAQAAACKIWPSAKVPRDYGKLNPSDVPALLITGEFDPVTPADSAEDVARRLRNAKHVVFSGASHSLAGLVGCMENIAADFLSKGSANGLDTSCSTKRRLPPFPAALEFVARPSS